MLKFKKSSIIIAMFLVIAGFAVANFVFAQVNVGTEYGAQIGLSNTDPRIIIARVIQVALGFLGIIAVGLIMYAGWLWMTSEGSEEKIDQAKNILKNAIIGLIIILSSFGIASFILSKMMGATGGGGGDGSGGGPGGPSGGGIGVLGSCTVESIYPEPGQAEVPRNTVIIVTFREEVKPETIMGGDGKILTDGRIMIYKDSDRETRAANFIQGIKVATTDNKTFVFTPNAYLGSSVGSTWYTIYLSSAIQKISGGGIFDTCSKDYLEWNFEVNNKLDLNPPQVNVGGVFPLPDSASPTNSVVQINFNEAINPMMVSGSADDVKDYIRVIKVGESGYLQGRFIVSNQYKTVEFLSDDQCGVNGCGEKIYCLPASSEIKVELSAAVLVACTINSDCDAYSPYNTCTGGHCQDASPSPKNYPTASSLNGIVDVASNSLDGNRNGSAVGPISFFNENSPDVSMGDNYQWSFFTGEKADTNPPKILSVSPNASEADLADPIIITFDKKMMFSSLRTGDKTIDNGKGPIVHKGINLISAKGVSGSDSVLPGYMIDDITDIGSPAKTQVGVWHSTFEDMTAYRAQVGSMARDNNQNCFNPSSGPNSSSGCIGAPSCCNGNPTGTLSTDGNCP